MLVLHSSALEGQLLLWGETPPEKPTRRRAKTSEPATSPFDPGVPQLAAALALVLPDLTNALDSEQLSAWLPSVGGAPIASSRLVAEPPADGAVTLTPWTVATLCLPVAVAVDLLCTAVGRDTL